MNKTPKNIQRIIQKHALGKSITEKEKELIRDWKNNNNEKPKILTWRDLAKELGVTASALYNWRKERKDCPDGKDLKEWRAWLVGYTDKQGSGGGRILVQGKEYTAADIHDLKAKLTGEQTRKERALADLRELELQQKRDSLVPESQLAEVIVKTLTPLRRLIDALPRAIASQANPTNPNIAELAIRNGLDDRVFGEIEKILSEYENN